MVLLGGGARWVLHVVRLRAQSIVQHTATIMSLSLVSTYGPNPSNVRARSTKLGASPTGDRILYAQGRTVVLRDMKQPRNTVLYAQHAHPVTVARMSPSGFYVASGDVSGKVRIWDVAGSEQMLKLEVQALQGRINDLTWDGESKRLLVVGEGREKYAHAFLFDTGSSVGELSGHSKPVNAVAVRAQRPFRAVSAADDNHVLFYTGVPFKYARTLTNHTRFVQDVAYAPNGATFASAGADGRLFVYDGTSGDNIGELRDEATPSAHQGTIFAISYAPDSSLLASAGADGYIRVWDVAGRRLLTAWQSDESDRVHAQQVGLTWTQEALVALSFGGTLRCFEVSESLQLVHALVAPEMGVVGLGVTPQGVVAASREGRLYTYAGEEVTRMPAHAPLPSLVSMASYKDTIAVTALDDAVRFLSSSQLDETRWAVSGQPRSVDVSTKATAVATRAGIDLVTRTTTTHVSLAQLGVPSASCIAVAPSGTYLAVGTDESRVKLYRWKDATSLESVCELTNGRSAITAMAFSPDASLLAVGESNGKILVYDIEAQQVKLSHWVFHTGRVYSIRWSPDGAYAVSASLYV